MTDTENNVISMTTKYIKYTKTQLITKCSNIFLIIFTVFQTKNISSSNAIPFILPTEDLFNYNKNGIYEETKDRRFKDGQIYILSFCCYGSIKKAVNS